MSILNSLAVALYYQDRQCGPLERSLLILPELWNIFILDMGGRSQLQTKISLSVKNRQQNRQYRQDYWKIANREK